MQILHILLIILDMNFFAIHNNAVRISVSPVFRDVDGISVFQEIIDDFLIFLCKLTESVADDNSSFCQWNPICAVINCSLIVAFYVTVFFTISQIWFHITLHSPLIICFFRYHDVLCSFFCHMLFSHSQFWRIL